MVEPGITNSEKPIFLSYMLSENTPLYGAGTGINFVPDKQMCNGDSCNTMMLTFPSHSGTHIDLPYHFDPKGKKLNDYAADFWLFNQVEIVDLAGRVRDSQIIKPEIFDIDNCETDLLLIKTGYGNYRGTDRYTLTSPGLSSELAGFFRQVLPKLRCVGMDLISISCYSNRDEGRKAHHAFLNPVEGEPILLIEDMRLDEIVPFNKVLVAPLLIETAEGAPCTIFGFPA